MRKPVAGEFYKHFKGKLYQVKMLAKDAGSGEEVVVYQAMYPPYDHFVRPLSEFVSGVDREKYPDAKQEKRFEKVALPLNQRAVAALESPAAEDVEEAFEEVSEEEFHKILLDGTTEKYLENRMPGAEIARRGFLHFLDAENFHEKRQIFLTLKPYLDDVQLNNIAVTLDFVLEETERDAQYDAILKCLNALEHYEGRRLR